MPTDACNMACIYCYHEPHFFDIEKISYKTLDHIMRISIPYYKKINFIWHGGEPLLMGIDFYKKAVELENKYNINDSLITNSIQTNLTFLNEDFADFFINNKNN